MMQGPKQALGPLAATLAVVDLATAPECSLTDRALVELAGALDTLLLSPPLLNGHLAALLARIGARSASGHGSPEHCFLAYDQARIDEFKSAPLSTQDAAWLRARRIDLLACNPAGLLEIHIDLRSSLPEAWLPMIERALRADPARAPAPP